MSRSEHKIGIAVVGYGYWGRNLVRNFMGVENCRVEAVCESDTSKHTQVHRLYPNIPVVAEFQEILKNPKIDAVVIATPVRSHASLAKAALEHGKHTLVEKPLTHSLQTAKELLALAEKRDRLLMVDHTFLYSGAVRHLKNLISEGALGDIQYIDSIRINLGLFQNDVNVLWDLAAHDLSICLHLLGKVPVSVQATGVAHTETELENIAYLTLKFEDKGIAHFNCSWVSPVKIRMMLIGGSKKMVVYNDMEPTEKIKIYDTGFTVATDEDRNRIIADYRIGDIHIPKIEFSEALSVMAIDFLSCIQEHRTPVSNARLGLEVVRILDAAEQSIRRNGADISLA